MVRLARSFPRLAASICTATLGASAALAFTPQSATITDTFPYVAGRALYSERGSPDKIFYGAGGGLLCLKHDASGLSYASAPPDVVDCSGYVADMAATASHFYVAAGTLGLRIVDRSDLSVVQVPNLADVWAVSAWSGQFGSIVAVGTQNPDGTGRLALYRHVTTTGAFTEAWSATTQKAVTCVALTTGLIPQPNRLSLLAGYRCNGDASLASLEHHELKVIWPVGSPWHLEHGAVAKWPSQSEGERFVRDLAVDASSSRLYVASYSHGVYAFDVAGSPTRPVRLFEDTSIGWPIRLPADTPPQFKQAFANVVALDPDPQNGGARLVVGFGAALSGETQYGSFCDIPTVACSHPSGMVPCGGTTADCNQGVYAYALSAQGQPSVSHGFATPEHSTAQVSPHGISIRPGTQNSVYLVDVNENTDGLTVLTPASGATFAVAVPGDQWNIETQDAPLHAWDTSIVLQDGAHRGLYVATELGLATFDLTQTLPLASAIDPETMQPGPTFETGEALVMSAFTGTNGRIYASTSRGRDVHYGGVRVYRLDGQGASFLDPKPIVFPAGPTTGEIHKKGFGFGIATTLAPYDKALEEPAAADRTRMLFAAGKAGASHVVAWNVGTAAAPNDPGANGLASGEIHDYIESDPIVALDGLAALYVSHATANDEIALYIGQGLMAGYSPTSPDIGVRIARYGLNSGALAYLSSSFESVWTAAEIHAAAAAQPRAAAVQVDPATQRLYVQWTCGMLAAFDISSGQEFSPTLVWKRKLDNATTPYNVVVKPGSTPSATTLYVSMLKRGIAVLSGDESTLATGAITFLPTRFQAIGMTLDPFSSGETALYVCQGRAGLDRIVIQ